MQTFAFTLTDGSTMELCLERLTDHEYKHIQSDETIELKYPGIPAFQVRNMPASGNRRNLLAEIRITTSLEKDAFDEQACVKAFERHRDNLAARMYRHFDGRLDVKVDRLPDRLAPEGNFGSEAIYLIQIYGDAGDHRDEHLMQALKGFLHLKRLEAMINVEKVPKMPRTPWSDTDGMNPFDGERDLCNQTPQVSKYF